MTNEELALAATQGDTVSLHKLYFAVAPLICKLTRQYFKYCEHSRKGVRPEDLTQSGYFAYLEALKYYSPEKELKFTSYLKFCVAKACWDEFGIVFRQGKAINLEVETISFETPISDKNEELTLEDVIADPKADTAEYAELSEMQIIVRQEIERLPENERCVIYSAFYENKPMLEIASEFGWSYNFAREMRYKAYGRLRSSDAIQALRKAYNWRSDDSFLEYLCLEDYDELFKNSGLEPIGGAIWE